MVDIRLAKMKNYKGFSLMESLIGVFIASTVFVTFLALLPGVIRTESYAQKTLIATGLAQEGIEMIRNLRENNLKVLGSACKAFEDDNGKGCHFPPSRPATPYRMDELKPSYIIGDAPDLIDNFDRTIKIEDEGADGKKVTCTVTFGGRTVEIINIMTAWGNSE